MSIIRYLRKMNVFRLSEFEKFPGLWAPGWEQQIERLRHRTYKKMKRNLKRGLKGKQAGRLGFLNANKYQQFRFCRALKAMVREMKLCNLFTLRVEMNLIIRKSSPDYRDVQLVNLQYRHMQRMAIYNFPYPFDMWSL